MYQISKLSTVHGQILRHLKNVWQPYRQPHRHRSPPILWASFHEAKKLGCQASKRMNGRAEDLENIRCKWSVAADVAEARKHFMWTLTLLFYLNDIGYSNCALWLSNNWNWYLWHLSFWLRHKQQKYGLWKVTSILRYPPPQVSYPYMHHGTCVTQVPWCMPGSLTSSFFWSQRLGKRSRHSRSIRNPSFFVSSKRPMVDFHVRRKTVW